MVAKLLTSLRLAAGYPVWRAEHRRKPGGFPARLSEAPAQPAQVRDGPGFREAQGTRSRRRRACHPGRLSFPYFFGETKK